MTECIIHIGMHKTGSTSIQQSLNGFVNDRFRYADLDHTSNHSFAMSNLFSASDVSQNSQRANEINPAELKKDIEQAKRKLEKAIRMQDGRHLIISGESISKLDKAALERLQSTLRPHFKRIRIVGYVRSPAAYISSIFQQFLKNRLPPLSADALYRPYRETFEKFDQVFGANNVALWKFDPASFPDHCVVSDFCARLDIALPGDRIIRVNESYSRQVIGLLYVYRTYAAQFNYPALHAGEANRLNMALKTLGNQRFRFSPQLSAATLVAQQEDIQWMERRLGDCLREELGDARPGDVAYPADLLHTPGEVVMELRALLGEYGPQKATELEPEEVAQLFHAFRMSQIEPKLHGVRKWAVKLRRWRQGLP
ncbi:hypothetical protein [Pseudomonas sp. N040]|uniref:hypothetical protein n=1 Tax=Pseudomonas sp. N040 TaxID=2785325 RepID=UPI0018A28FB6|nr:hypothetical protein [Pseudomonas sp. N040]MBF7731743.1 hypothetical protein [Pseudomonas sp. N040]MBW7015387.1 hypothetical protein [Pseudomonas sp. N040]